MIRTCVEPVTVVRGAVASILVDDLFSLGTEETKECLTIAQMLMQQFSRPTEIEKTLASWMTDHSQKIIEESKRGAGEATGCTEPGKVAAEVPQICFLKGI